MNLLCCSVSFRDAPYEAREKLAFSEDQQRRFLRGLRRYPTVREGLILCTCNRTEVYLSVDGTPEGGVLLEPMIAEIKPSAREPWRRYRKIWEGAAAVEHLFRVAAGLDSQLLGEHQIISQLKAAYALANEERTTSWFFHRLMHRAFRASKEVRSRTILQSGTISLGAAALELAWKELPLPGAKVLLLGAGENAELVARLLVKAGISQLWIVSRHLQSARQLAAALQFGCPFEMSQLGRLLQEADLALCTTASPTPLITSADHAYLLAQRSRPLVMIDLAMPRDVEPSVGQMEQVRLFNLEDLNRRAEAGCEIQTEQIQLAEQIAAEQAQQFIAWLDSLQTSDVVAELASRYVLLAQKEARRYNRYFSASEHAQLQRFAESLARKILHGPIAYLKQTGRDEPAGDWLGALDLVRKMFLEFPETKRKKQ
ncbi:MAG TPA: glutamyl-tRNA reductase [Anaerohalosphaeraceae bacterium]|nr:glutamyl-tRNA reductase [Anaerohalosphaeraceae bacterium]HPB93308.1 glutamyl-tRNA reductase [Anaerohalosphaeraceae bacterium]HRT24088.1 glutamyl-tRNA reductase [Anaerohalosphaeraceae bacterium]